jgi:hypothetical protein
MISPLDTRSLNAAADASSVESTDGGATLTPVTFPSMTHPHMPALSEFYIPVKPVKHIPFLPLPLGKPIRFLTSIPVSFEEAARMHPFATMRRQSRRSQVGSTCVIKPIQSDHLSRVIIAPQPSWMEKEPSPSSFQPAQMSNEFGRPGRSGYACYPSPVPSHLEAPLSPSLQSRDPCTPESDQLLISQLCDQSTRESRRVKRYTCTVCSKPFSRPSTLQTHMNGHTGAKPFECSVDGCTARFSVLSNRNRHQKLCLAKASSG